MFELPEPSTAKLLFLLAFILPGIISTKVYHLKCPGEGSTVKESIFEIFAFSAVNFTLMFPFIAQIGKTADLWEAWGWVILCFFAAPILWPVLLVYLLNRCARYGLILSRSQTAWDYFFSRAKSGCWIIIHLKNGEKIGGRFSKNSYASAFPRNGHIYVEELWSVDDDLNFIVQLPGNQGIILRPEDYEHLRVFS